MGRRCPLGGYVLYLDCLECDDKVCKRSNGVVSYVRAQKGYKFVPTEEANEQVRAKYTEGYFNTRQYSYKVPISWVEKGYVVEVRESG